MGAASDSARVEDARLIFIGFFEFTDSFVFPGWREHHPRGLRLPDWLSLAYQWRTERNLSEKLKENGSCCIDRVVTATSSEESVATRASLLARIKDWEDHDSWREFFDTYWQLIHCVALKSGLNQTEAQDAVQETVLAVAKNIGNFEYDPHRCSFKTWLMLITRQRIIWQFRKRLPSASGGAQTDGDLARTSTTDQIPDPSPEEEAAVWDREWQRNFMAVAVERVKEQANPKHFQIFDLYVLQDWTAAEVARKLQIGIAQVYLAKHRVSVALKKEMKRLEHAANHRRRRFSGLAQNP